MKDNSKIRVPLVNDVKDLRDISSEVLYPLNNKPNYLWYIIMSISILCLGFGIFCIWYTLYLGIGVWGNNNSVCWAFAIVNFVFWVGIGHAGTFISAVLLVFNQRWRNSINRAAETMTIFAVLCAGLYPLLHLGRPWMAHWFLPYPSTRMLFVNFHSPLIWDVFAITTYIIVSLVFWYLGQLPDWAFLRDNTKSILKKYIYSFLSMGWTGSYKQWERHEVVSMVLAGLSAPLVLSVHSIVGTDFATSLLPGWHATIFPPYFVAGAVFSGFGMVITIMIIVRQIYNFDKSITPYHIDQMCKVIIVTGSMVSLAYFTEFFVAWYSGNTFEQFVFLNRAFGPYSKVFWLMFLCNVITPHLLWFEYVRRNYLVLFIVSIFINVGMWCERFVIIIITLHATQLPASWAMYFPTWVEVGIFIGTFGLFFTGFFTFLRVGPYIAASEVKVLAAESLNKNIDLR